jgi:tetratricopeptide (TPR) repeat protein
MAPISSILSRLRPRPGKRRDPERLKLKTFLKFARLGDRARDEGNWIIAARYYDQALKWNPHRVAYWIQYGHASKLCGDHARAEVAYRTALNLDPDNADGHLQLGHLLKLGGRLQEAIESYARAAELAPDLEYIRQELASCMRHAQEIGVGRLSD